MENNIILYSTDCPKCQVLTKKLNEKRIQFNKNTSVDEMLNIGITQVPMLMVNGELMDYKESVEWINQQE